MGSRKLKECFNILVSVYEYQSESIYNLFSYSWEMQTLLQHQELWILFSVLKQDYKIVIHYCCHMAMCLDFFHEKIIKFTSLSGLFGLLELFGCFLGEFFCGCRWTDIAHGVWWGFLGFFKNKYSETEHDGWKSVAVQISDRDLNITESWFYLIIRVLHP